MHIDHSQLETWQQRFAKNWLFEMTQHTGRSKDRFAYLLSILNRALAVESPVPMGSERFRVRTPEGELFWQERSNQPVIIMDTTPFGGGYAVTLVGKARGDSVDAADFYLAVSRVTSRLIFSGDMISDQGLQLWQKLVINGSVDAYNTRTATEFPIDSAEDIVDPKFDDPDVRFVLSENVEDRLQFQHAFALLEAVSLTHEKTRNDILRRED